MRARLALVAFLFAAAAGAASVPALAKGGNAGPAPGPAPASDSFVVHEWGTFTSVQGEGGLVLEGLEHEEEALPDFVYSRSKVRDCPLRAVGWKGLEVPAEHVTQKMETPVVYFHGKSPRRVRVRVDFVKGILTQWYPVSDLLGPPEGARDAGPLDVSKVERSFIQWDVDLSPGGAAAPAEMPEVAASDPWSFARNVDSMWVRTVPRKGPERRGPSEADRFLFYRGLGAFDLPFRADVPEDGKPSFKNGSAHAVAQVVAIEVGPGGKEGRYSVATGVAPGTAVADLLAGRETERWRGGAVEGLKEDLQKILRGQGMNADEAAAMVATWTRSWFLSEGTRVVYVVPRPLVDALLPLSIDPAPSEVRRALVGRIECVTPAARRGLEEALKERGVHDAARHEKGEAALGAWKARLGRFYEANLRAVLATTADVAVRDHVRALLRTAKEAEPR